MKRVACHRRISRTLSIPAMLVSLSLAASPSASQVALDIDDDGIDESTSVDEIATENDLNGVLIEESADKIMIDMGVPWLGVGSANAENSILHDDGTNTDQLFVDRDGDGILDTDEGLAFPEHHVVDSDDDGDIDDEDVQAAIDSCGISTGNAITGCKVILPRGRIDIDETLRIGCDNSDDPDGRCTADSNQRGIQIHGQGQGIVTTSSNSDSFGGGTVLTWQGADGGTMLKIFHAARFALADFAMDMDGSTTGEAGVAIELIGSATSPTQGGTIDRVWIAGDGGSGVVNTSIGILHTCQDGDCTTTGDGQFDKMSIRDVGLYDLGTCYFGEDQQNQLTELYKVDCSYDQTGIEIQGGDITVRSSTIIEDSGVDDNSGTQYAITLGELTTGTTEAAGMVTIISSHFEIKEGFITSDDKSQGLEAGAVNLIGNRFNFKCDSPPCTQTFMDVHTNYMIRVTGNYFRSNGGDDRTAEIDVDDGSREGVGGLWWQHNTRSELSAAELKFDAQKTSARIVKVDTDSDGVLYNDVDFDFIRDSGEAIFDGSYSCNRNSPSVGDGCSFEASGDLSLLRLACWGEDSSGADFVASVLECDSNGENCASAGGSLQVAVTSETTKVSDDSGTDVSIDDEDVLRIEFTTVTDSPAEAACSLRYVSG